MINEIVSSFYSLIPELFATQRDGSRKQQMKQFLSEARRAAALANQENLYGEAAISALENSLDSKATSYRQNLSAIAIWHFERCAEKYREAADGFETAARLVVLKRNRKKLQSKAAALRHCANQVERAAHSAQLIQNSFALSNL